MIKSDADKAYFADPAMSSHKLADFRRAPYYYLAKHVAGTVREGGSRAMGFGSWVHMACLEPQRYAKTVLIAPKACETEAGNMSESEKSRSVLKATGHDIDRFVTQKEFDEIAMIRQRFDDAMASIYGEPDGDVKTEVVYFLRNKPDLPALKCKIDLIVDGKIWDLKTIGNLSEARKSIVDFGYLEQMAFYSLVSGLNVGGLIFVERGSCPRYQIVNVLPETIYTKKLDILETLKDYQTCQQTGVWPCHPCGSGKDDQEQIYL